MKPFKETKLVESPVRPKRYRQIDSTEAFHLRDRVPELFKVVSKGGVPEIWLMGKKLTTFGP